MSVVAKLTFWSDDMVLAETFSRVEGLEFHDYRAVAKDPHRPHLFFWTRADDFEAFEAAMDDDETVADYEYYGDRPTGDVTERLYRIHVSETTEVVAYPAWVESRGDVVEGGYVDGHWYGRMRFPDRDRLEVLLTFFDDEDIDYTVEAVYDDSGTSSSPLTTEQRRALVLASEAGYFEVPREAALSDLASELEVSTQAVSERLRRAYGTLVEAYVR